MLGTSFALALLALDASAAHCHTDRGHYLADYAITWLSSASACIVIEGGVQESGSLMAQGVLGVG